MSDFAPETGPDGRPRPRFGEYATPEEQRARIRQPDVTAALDSGVTPVAEPAARTPGWTAPAAPVEASAAPAKRRTGDRIATFALLAYGLVTVVTSIPALADYTAYTQLLFDTLGVDATLSDPAGARPWGVAAALVLGIGWLVTAVVSWLSMRAGRLTWWIPLVGGVVFNTASAFVMLVPLMSDPAVWSALEKALLG